VTLAPRTGGFQEEIVNKLWHGDVPHSQVTLEFNANLVANGWFMLIISMFLACIMVILFSSKGTAVRRLRSLIGPLLGRNEEPRGKGGTHRRPPRQRSSSSQGKAPARR